VFDLDVTAGEVGELTQGTAVADEDWAPRRASGVGDRVTALFPSGQSRAFTITGIFVPPEAGCSVVW
jgi:hypothetical protein